MKLVSAAFWLEQAKADLVAANKLGGCHARYLLQQAYEKGVKAFGLAILPKSQLDDKQFSSAVGTYFLHHHTPMTVLSKDKDDVDDELKRAYPKDWQNVSAKLAKFRTGLRLSMLAGADIATQEAWAKVDATRPSKSPECVSYRYPFFDPGSGDETAPVSWQGWDNYQGVQQVVHKAIEELLKKAGQQVKAQNHAP